MSTNGSSKKDASARGLFLFSHAYWASASALEIVKVDSGHRHSPVNYLYFHAIELFLKSYLLHCGTTHDDLRKKYSHKLKKIAKAAEGLGLKVEQADFDALELVDQNYIDARYLRTGQFTRAHPANLWGTCSVLFDQIGDVLMGAGKLSRLPNRPEYPYSDVVNLSVEEVAELLVQKRDADR